MYRFFDFTIAASIVKSSYNDPSKSTGNCFEPTVPSFLSMLFFFSSLVGSWNLLKILSKSMCFYVYSSLIRSENRYTETHLYISFCIILEQTSEFAARQKRRVVLIQWANFWTRICVLNAMFQIYECVHSGSLGTVILSDPWIFITIGFKVACHRIPNFKLRNYREVIQFSLLNHSVVLSNS